jgi:outer membrane protein
VKKYFILFLIACAPIPAHASSYTADVLTFLSVVYQNHPTLISERLQYQQSQLGVTEAEGLYDPAITGRINRQKDAATYFSQTGQIISKETTTLQAGISQKLSSGADIGIGVQSTQQDNNGSSYSSRLSLDMNQPLLNGFGEIPTAISIMTAKLSSDTSRKTYEISVASTLQTALDTYAQYIVAWQKQRIYEDDLALSQYLLSQIKRKNSLDMSDTVALLDAEIQLATVEEAQRKTAYERKALAAELQKMTGRYWEPLTATSNALPESPTLKNALEIALTHNPDLLAADIAIAKQQLIVTLKENNSLPTLDLNGSLGYNKSGSDWQSSIQFQDPSFSVGLSTSFPWGNKEANTQLATAKLALQDLENQRNTLAYELIQDIESSYSDVDLAKAQLTHYQNIITLANKKLTLEKKKFELGLALVDTVLEAKKYKTDTAIQAASAELDYIQACLKRDSLLGNLSAWVSL